MSTCAFIGHSDCPEGVKEKLLLEIENLIVNEKVDKFYVGTHGAFDRLVYEVLCELEKKYKIIIKIALAYLNRENELTYYDTNKTIFPDCVAKVPPRFAITRRNNYMLQKADYLICFLNHQFSNTYEFVLKAVKKNIKIINLGNLAVNHICIKKW